VHVLLKQGKGQAVVTILLEIGKPLFKSEVIDPAAGFLPGRINGTIDSDSIFRIYGTGS